MHRAPHIAFTLLLAFAAWAFGGFATTTSAEVKTQDYYDSNARVAAKAGDYEKMKSIVDEGMKYYPDATGLNELAGLYYYKKKDYDTSRYYLYRSLQANDDNVLAKQLMVDVEEETKNYSSAICYVNELLELTPYWRGLWNRKIQLFRKQGNLEEAERLLKRLRKIYPEDQDIANEYLRHVDGRYEAHRAQGDVKGMIADIEEIVESGMAYSDHYLILSNLYLSRGDTERALAVLGEGVSKYPTEDLVRKKVGILAGAERYGEANAFLDAVADAHPGLSFVASLRQGLLEERARVEAMNDPYTLYGKLYAEHKSAEALEYLVATSFARGYDVDALFYLDEEIKRKGRTPGLLYRKYMVHKRINNFAEARGILEEIYRMQPTNEEVAAELTRIKLEDATQSMLSGDYADAITALEVIDPKTVEPELAMAIFNRLYTCYSHLGKWEDAEQALDGAFAVALPEDVYISRKAQLLHDSGREREAIDFVKHSFANMPAEADSLNRLALMATYEELAVPYIKRLIENGAINAAYQATKDLLEMYPQSKDGLTYGITTTALLGYNKEHDELVARARELYQDDITFMLKQAGIYTREKDYKTALRMVRPYLNIYPGNRDLVNSYAENSELLALEELKDHRPDSALVTVDRALYFDRYNKQLLYTKGLAFEAKRMYDSAYIYQSNYVPGPLEIDEYKQHLKTLQSLHYTNTIGLEYLQGRYGEADVITAVATAFYNRKNKRDSWTATLNYAGRDGSDAGDGEYQTPGGVGLQGMGTYVRPFRRGWEGSASLALATRYFPQIHINLGARKELRNEWVAEGSLSLRRIENFQKEFVWSQDPEVGSPGAWIFDRWAKRYRFLLSLGGGVEKSILNFATEAHIDFFLMQSSFYFNVVVRGRYFPLTDRRTSVYALASVGTAPEASVLDEAMPGTFKKLNSVVGVGGMYLLHRTLGLGVLGTWHTFYNQSNRRVGTETDYHDVNIFTYRNLFNISGQLYIYF